MVECRTAAERVTDALARLTCERDIWLGTSSGDGPWLIPLWFLWHKDRIFLATSATSRTSQNIASHPRVRLAFQSTADVVIIDGDAAVRHVADIDASALDAYAEKYDGSDPRQWANTALIDVTPTRAQAWRGEEELPDRVIMRGGRWADAPTTGI